MKVSLLQNKGYSLIFAIVVVTIALIMVSDLADVTIRNMRRGGEWGASWQAQSNANSAFELARGYIDDNCQAGCDVSDGEFYLEEDVSYGYYDILGIAGQNSEGVDDYLYYVPIPGYGDAGEDCGSDYVVGDPDKDSCNWNKIFYGNTVQIPLYVDGEDMFGGVGAVEGDEFYIKVRTPLCEDTDVDYEYIVDEMVNRRLIGCLDGYTVTLVTNALGGCDSVDEDKVVLTWQIRGEMADGGGYVEGWEDIDRFGRTVKDSEIYTTLINSQLNSDYTVVDISDIYAPYDETNATIQDALAEMTEPVLYLTFVQTIRNDDVPLPYLEYQIVSDEPISSDRSFIFAKGYYVLKGIRYFWNTDGTYSQYTDSLINFVFQN